MASKELQLAKQVLDEAVRQKQFNKAFIENLGPVLAQTLESVLQNVMGSFSDKVLESSQMTKAEIMDAVSKITINVPKIDVPETRVNVPAVDLTELKNAISIKDSEPVNVKVNLEIL